MYIAYYDESGDDGYPLYSSDFFVLSSLYFHYSKWQELFKDVREFRRNLRSTFGLPINLEMHTRDFLLNKDPYRILKIQDQDRIKIIDHYCELIGNLDLKVINVVIVKPRIRKGNYDVLDTALKYSIQRIENDLATDETSQEKFMIISDPGRIGKMRKTTRRIQRINFIPSKFSKSSYRKEIASLIEDPLEKDSKESYFIQFADVVSLIIYLHATTVTGIGHYSNRLAKIVSTSIISNWMNTLKPKFNLLASCQDQYGIVYHPQK